MRFTLRQLEGFVAIAEHGSISAAARATHASQAALSESLQGLERALGQTLAVRSRARGVTLTSSGRRFAVDARRLLRQAHDVEDRIQERESELAGPLELGCYVSLAPFWLPFIAAEFVAPNPRLDVRIVEGDGRELQRRMLAGELDAVLTHTGHLVDGVEHEAILPGRSAVLVAAHHTLARAGSVRLAQLADEDYVLLDMPAVRDVQLPRLAALGVQPRIRWRSSSLEAVRGMVARGLGWTVLVQRPPAGESYEGLGLAVLEIEDPIGPSDVCLAFPGAPMSRRLRALIRLCREEGAHRVALGGDAPDAVQAAEAGA